MGWGGWLVNAKDLGGIFRERMVIIIAHFSSLPNLFSAFSLLFLLLLSFFLNQLFLADKFL